MVKKKVYKIVWDRKALDELKHQLDYISKQSEQAPKIVKESILARLKVLKSDPLLYEADKLKDDKDENYRAFIVYSYRVTYQIKESVSELRIIRIRHTSREPLDY